MIVHITHTHTYKKKYNNKNEKQDDIDKNGILKKNESKYESELK